MSHLSPLALEALLSGEPDARATRHVATCGDCQRQLATLELRARPYSGSRWRRGAAALALSQVLLVALISPWALAPREVAPAPVTSAAAPAAHRARQGRERLSVRAEPSRTNLRAVSLRGREVQLGQGALEATDGSAAPRPFTLVHTKVGIDVTGFVQAVTVTQVFENPFRAPVEAVYVFPLPEDAAVHALTLVAGERTLRGVIQKREAARQQYERAKAEGRRAALLDQERPNLFTQSLANLLPGERVEVTLSYVAPLRFDDGVYTLNFPMTVGPRYVPGAVLPGESQGTGVVPDTATVPDASRITPPETRSGRDVEVSVRLAAGTVIEDLWSASHQLELERPSAREARLSLDPADAVPNKDLVVRWRVSGDEARAAVLAGGGAFALLLSPERAGTAAPVTPRELVFVIDTSGSMQGAPLAAAKRAMAVALSQLQPQDTFLLVDFAEKASSYSPAPLPATREHLDGALRYLRELPSGGSTNQLAGLRRALSRPEDPERLRLVLLMTDGFIGNEEEIFAESNRLRRNARIFGFGVGSAVNHFLLSRLSEEGRGFYQYVRPGEDPTEAVQRFARRVQRPLITDVTVDWGGLAVADALPARIPDLFDAQPLIIHGRYRAPGAGVVTLRGRRAGLPVTFEAQVELPSLDSPGRGLTTAWARKRLEALSALQHGGVRAEVSEEITLLGLEHHLVTQYTSFVAVDSAAVTNVAGATIAEPTLTPDLTAPRSGLLRVIGSSGGGALESSVGGLTGASGFGTGGGAPCGTCGGLGLGARGTGAGGGGFGTRGTAARAGVRGVLERLSQDDLAAVLRSHRGELASCVERQALINPALTGPLVIRWLVDPDGRTRDVVVLTKDLEHSEAARCIRARILKWRFPAHGGAAQALQFPFAL